MTEADLYPAVKAYLEGQGYTVKAEVGACDVMALRAGDPPVIVELKLSFSLALVMQGIARQGLFDLVYLAVPVSSDRGWKLRYKDITGLCRRLGLGLLAVEVGRGTVEAHLDPAPYAPRKNTIKAGLLLREFERRVGDHNRGGSTRVKQMTAYRQDALRCALQLAAGPCKAATVTKACGVARAAVLMRTDHYGWFERAEHGIYALTAKGFEALVLYKTEIAALTPPAPLS